RPHKPPKLQQERPVVGGLCGLIQSQPFYSRSQRVKAKFSRHDGALFQTF
ncbi:MAG: hypothetical protein ACI823_002813, partial [Chitinophagales bacterium]